MVLLTCSGVSLSYEGRTVVENLSFEVNQGDYLCIVGENGSGKSTLIRGLLGLKQPQEGQIVLGGGLQTQEIGYLPQQTMVQKDFPASVEEVVLSGRLNTRGFWPFYKKTDRQAALENMRRLAIDNLKRRCYRELSGGQQQRVLLARALCATQKLLVLDEPVAGLDPVATQELYRLIAEINHDSGITIIMVSHDLHSVTHQASHILHLKKGKIFFGTREAYVNSPLGRDFVQGRGGEAHA